MSTVLLTGGTGALGSHIAARLRERGQEVRELSRRQGVGSHVGDLSTGGGVADAARGAEVIVHAAFDTRRLGRGDEAQTNNASERLPLAMLPLDFRFQTIAAAEVAERAAELAQGQPARTIVNVGGPEVLTLGQMAELWRTERGRPRRLVRLPLAGRAARAFREGRNTSPEHAEGTQSWAQFVAAGPSMPYKVSVAP